MGYDMYSNGGEHYFRANISGMVFLRDVMEKAGVDFQMGKGMRETSNERDKPYSAEGSLATCFGSNDGWHVRPEECLHIAEKLTAIVGTKEPVTAARVVDKAGNPAPAGDRRTITIPLTDDDRAFIQEFIDFNRKSAVLGGYFVW